MRKRSSYRPRPILRDPVSWVIGGFQRLTDVGDQNMTLRLRNHTALESVLRGTATMQDVDTLIAASNMATALKHVGKGGDWSAEIRAGTDAIEALRNRSRKVCTGPEIQAIRLMMEIHDAQLDACTIADLDAALTITRKAQVVAV